MANQMMHMHEISYSSLFTVIKENQLQANSKKKIMGNFRSSNQNKPTKYKSYVANQKNRKYENFV